MADLHDASIRDVNEARNFITRRHAEYRAVDALCRWILDTLECGEQYKTSTYNANWPYGDVQNLMRHMREYPLETADVQTSAQQWAQIFLGVGNADSPDVRQMAAYNRAARMNYEFRLMRTPTPTHLRRVLDKHLSKIYSQTPRREIRGIVDAQTADEAIARTPAPVARLIGVKSWWNDVDGRGTDINEWMRETVAPLLIALGMVDLYFDHPSLGMTASAQEPQAPAFVGSDAAIQSEADVIAANLKGCTVQVILPSNVLWYELDYTGKYYTQILVREYDTVPQDKGYDRYVETFRHWTGSGWTLYGLDGNIIGEGVHRYGRVPIVRAFDRRHVRIPHAGDPRFLGIVEKCREYFNVESEMIYAMDMQCFAMLQAPPVEFNEAGDAIPVGVGMVLYMVADPNNGAPVGYSYIAPPVEPLRAVMDRLDNIAADIDMEAGLNRPSSAAQKGGRTYPASGISKAFDQEEGNTILAGIAMALEACEYLAAEFAATVLMDGVPAPDVLSAVQVVYTKQFNLLRYDEMSVMSAEFVNFRDACGLIPTVEKHILKWMTGYMIRDADPAERAVMNKEIDAYVDEKVRDRKEASAIPTQPRAIGNGNGAIAPPLVPTVPADQNPN